MRSIPHRVVCLLGLDDGSFPRHVERDGDDLTARNPRVGDRDVRSEDRQLLLDALLAAQDHLVVLYSGRDERSNQHRPPAVPVGELLDVIDHTATVPEGKARDVVVLEHALQPFDAKNYKPGALIASNSWSFDTLHLAGARSALHPRQRPPAFLGQPLAEPAGPQVGLDQLERFLRHPVRAFLRERLKISLAEKTRDFEDAIPLELEALEQWKVADRMLGGSARRRQRGVLPRGGDRHAARSLPGSSPIPCCRRSRSPSTSSWRRDGATCHRTPSTCTLNCPTGRASSGQSAGYGATRCRR